MAQIHELIGKAMGEVGAIGKDSRNNQQGFMYRGIDAVYNALNPVMAKYGLFICPEVIDQKREERTTKNGSAITYTILTMKYTIYAPDGSNVSCTVVGEGMDSGDKSSNKAMSVAMKYAMFQLFFIPTEELKDPDADVYEVQPKRKPEHGVVSTVNKIPEQKNEVNPVIQFLLTAKAGLAKKRGIDQAANHTLFTAQHKALVKAKLAPDKPATEYTMEEAQALIEAMERCFDLTGTELKTE